MTTVARGAPSRLVVARVDKLRRRGAKAASASGLAKPSSRALGGSGTGTEVGRPIGEWMRSWMAGRGGTPNPDQRWVSEVTVSGAKEVVTCGLEDRRESL